MAKHLSFETNVRVVCKLRDTIDLGDEVDASRIWTEVLDGAAIRLQHPGLETRRLFKSSTSAELKAFTDAARLGATVQERGPQTRAGLPNLNSYVLLTLPRTGNPSLLTQQLLGLSHAVEFAYIDPDSRLPIDPQPDNDPFFIDQDYLNPAKGGIDIHAAWNVSGDGTGVNFADVEKAWSLGHLDLPPVSVVIGPDEGSIFEMQHGTRVLEIVLAKDNTLGIIGMAPNVQQAFVASVLDTHRADAIQKAADTLRQNGGGVLLIELELQEPGLPPVEACRPEFEVIRQAAFQPPSAPVVVVECAGNGGTDLDTFTPDPPPPGRRSLKRAATSDEDSGAILVGAVKAGETVRKLLISNFGSRVDCNGWGEKVRTSQDGHFGGTSSAGAIIAGACCVVQGLHFQEHKTFLNSVAMRDLLTEFPATHPSGGHPEDSLVGVMPDLKSIVDKILTSGLAAPVG
jgi:hypothetical protein